MAIFQIAERRIYICWKCLRQSYEAGGLPVCCYCGAKASTVLVDTLTKPKSTEDR